MAERDIITSTYYGASVYECGLFDNEEDCIHSDRLARQVLGFPTIVSIDDECYADYLKTITAVFEQVL